MANTEGMPDEVMESLLRMPSPPTTNFRNSSSNMRQQRLNQRMEMPMGERPAAKVVRKSRNFGSRNSAASRVNENQAKTAKAQEPTGSALPLVVGSIVERTRKNNSSTSASSGAQSGKVSRFAQQRQSKAALPTTGFPSTNFPLGTFSRPKRTTTRSSQTAVNHPTKNTKQTVDNDKNKGLSNLLDSCSKDADAMLSQMSESDKLDYAKELRGMLSPETLQFLSQRAGTRETDESTITKERPSSDSYPTEKTTTIPATTKAASVTNTTDSSLVEKKRMGEILSSIKTYDDLDTAYSAEMGDYTPIRSKEESGETDWQLACNLLRSTSPRQNLWAAKIVFEHLQKDLQEGKRCYATSRGDEGWPYPVLLPVSLRCLLDSSFFHTNGYILHTYVLQSLHILLCLRANPNHVVHVTTSARSSSAIYQEYFLEDNVPTPPLEQCYPKTASAQPLNHQGEQVAYVTSSSSASAKADGENFCKDPIWTLLSRMRIIPCLAKLLASASSSSTSLPSEAITAFCGILSMLSQRSPGAASAIVQHPTLFGGVVDLTVAPPTGPVYDATLYMPGIMLLCTLARQSRTAASRIDFDSFGPPVLAMKPTCREEHRLQQWTLVLWRTLLRYGLGLQSLHAMLTISAQHFALDPFSKFSLSTEFSTAFINVLDCVRAIQGKTAVKKSIVSSEQEEVLDHAVGWLPPSMRQVLLRLESIDYISFSGKTKLSEKMRVNAGRLRLLSTYFNLWNSGTTIRIKADKLSDTADTCCLKAMKSLLDSGIVEKAFRVFSTSAFNVEFGAQLSQDNDLPTEAAACAFMESFVSLLLAMFSRRSSDPDDDQQEVGDVMDMIVAIVDGLACILLEFTWDDTNLASLESNSTDFPAARRGWLNQACFALIKFLRTATAFNILQWSRVRHLIRVLEFTLIGRLERGDEAMALLLFNEDVCFKPFSKHGTTATSRNKSSALSSVFLLELCRTDLARKQLDHSFKMNHGLGLNSDGYGPLALDSLLSEADRQSPLPNAQIKEFLLPMGPLWLWQVLSGTIQQNQTTTAEISAEGRKLALLEAEEILSFCLRIFVELEHLEVQTKIRYSSRIPEGAKLYHLMNIILQTENVLRLEQVTAPAEELLEQYLKGVNTEDQNSSFLFQFSQACLLHSDLSSSATAGQDAPSSDADNTRDESELNAIAEQIAAKLPAKENRALLEFAGDMCEKYIEYGAQYDIFTKFIRTLLMSVFPTNIRCEVLRRLSDVFHLLSLPAELEEDGASVTKSLLERSMLGGLHIRDGGSTTSRDSPEFLDAIASVFARGRSNTRIAPGYALFLAIASLCRSLASSLDDASGLVTVKNRLRKLEPELVSIVLEVTDVFLSSSNGQTKQELIQVTMEVTRNWKYGTSSPTSGESNDLDESINLILNKLDRYKSKAHKSLTSM